MSTDNSAGIDIGEVLREPFEPHEVKWKPQSVKGNRALAVAYVDARVVQDRLDDVFGPGGWQDAYHVIANGSVVCTLKAWINGQWVEKTDIGSQSEQPDESDRLKAAFSDALKRAAIKFGIGRYLYRLPLQWVDFDPAKKQLVKTPTLPKWAMPASKTPENASDYVTPEEWGKVRDTCIKRAIPQRLVLEHFKIARPGELLRSKLAEALTLANTITNPEQGE